MKFNKISALVLALSTAGAAQAALTAGDIAIIGRTNNGSPDAFSFVALSNISAGEVIYFTDNGWTGSAFRGASATDGDGNENFTMWTASANVAAGTIIASTSAGFATSGAIPGVSVSSDNTFSSLDQSQSGEQIYAFQNTNSSNPLFNLGTATQLYALDDTNGFENATNTNNGGIPTGLTAGSTAITLNFTGGNTIAVKANVLSGGAKTKQEWLTVFADANNWATAAALPTTSIAITAVPEPTSGAIALAGLGVAGLLARRRKAA